jgi:type I restriction enzyme, S subunit
MDEVPEGWACVSFGEVIASSFYGPRFSANDYVSTGVPTVRTTDMDARGRINLKEAPRVALTAAALEKFGLRDGDLLVTRTGTIGRCALYHRDVGPAIPSAYLIRFRMHLDLVDPRFAFLFLQSPSGQSQLGMGTTSVTQPNVNARTIGAFVFPLPSLAEQRRIVEKVEALLAEVNTARARLAKIPPILKRFRQSTLSAACSGRLTEEWRGAQPVVEQAGSIADQLRRLHEAAGKRKGNAAEPTEDVHVLEADSIPESWALVELERLCEPGRPITYGILKPGPNTPGGVPYVRVADFPGDLLNTSGVKRTTQAIANDFRRSTLMEGDILLSIRGTYGRVCRVPVELVGGNITQDTARLSVHPLVNPAYVERYLRSPSAQSRLKAAAKGVAVHGVNIGDVRALQVELPSGAEQQEIVRRVDALFAVADAIEARVAIATARADKLTQSVLAKAFRGELVPTEADLAHQEGHEYEPASALLERLGKGRDQGVVEEARPGRRSRSGVAA